MRYSIIAEDNLEAEKKELIRFKEYILEEMKDRGLSTCMVLNGSFKLKFDYYEYKKSIRQLEDALWHYKWTLFNA